MANRPEGTITIVIPTVNRPEFLVRQLAYYAGQHFPYPLVVADSSDTRTIIPEVLLKSLNITHLELPREGVAEAIIAANQQISTKYAAFIGDDDFFIPEGLAACAEFLDSHPDYGAANGKAWAFALPTPYGKASDISYSDSPETVENTAGGRLREYLAHYNTTLFSVNRTENWLKMWSPVCTRLDQWFGDELLPSCMAAILGKVKSLPDPYMVRQGHPGRIFGLPVYEWLHQDQWQFWYHVFCDTLSAEIAGIDKISYEVARVEVELAFSVYMSQYHGKYWRDYSVSETSPIVAARQFARKVPGFLKVWSFINRQKTGSPSQEVNTTAEIDNVINFIKR